MKKKSLFAALAISLIIPTSAFASSGWDYVGASTFVKQSVVVNSTGGDFKVCQTSGKGGNVALWENDAGANPDDSVEGFMTPGRYLAPGQCAVWDVRDMVDGDNKKAELYVVKAGDGNSISVKFYD